jgi:chaperonin GroEL
MKIVMAGTNPVQLTRGMEATVQKLVVALAGLSTDVKVGWCRFTLSNQR